MSVERVGRARVRTMRLCVVVGSISIIGTGFPHHPRVHEIALAATSEPSPKDKSTINVNFRMIVFAVSMSLLSDRWLME